MKIGAIVEVRSYRPGPVPTGAIAGNAAVQNEVWERGEVLSLLSGDRVLVRFADGHQIVARADQYRLT